MDGPSTCLDFVYLAILKEAFPWQTTQPHPAIDRIKLESRLVAKDDVQPLGKGQISPPHCPRQAHSPMIGSQWGFPQGRTSTVATGHKYIVESLAASPDSIQVLHPEATHIDHYDIHYIVLNTSSCQHTCILMLDLVAIHRRQEANHLWIPNYNFEYIGLSTWLYKPTGSCHSPAACIHRYQPQ